MYDVGLSIGIHSLSDWFHLGQLNVALALTRVYLAA